MGPELPRGHQWPAFPARLWVCQQLCEQWAAGCRGLTHSRRLGPASPEAQTHVAFALCVHVCHTCAHLCGVCSMHLCVHICRGCHVLAYVLCVSCGMCKLGVHMCTCRWAVCRHVHTLPHRDPLLSPTRGSRLWSCGTLWPHVEPAPTSPPSLLALPAPTPQTELEGPGQGHR